MDDRILSPKQLAEEAGVSEQTVLSWIRDTKIPFHELANGRKYFKYNEVRDFIDVYSARKKNIDKKL